MSSYFLLPITNIIVITNNLTPPNLLFKKEEGFPLFYERED